LQAGRYKELQEEQGGFLSCQSPRNQVYPQGYRGFESHPVRHKKVDLRKQVRFFMARRFASPGFQDALTRGSLASAQLTLRVNCGALRALRF